jgi:hypothetical protein
MLPCNHGVKLRGAQHLYTRGKWSGPRARPVPRRGGGRHPGPMRESAPLRAEDGQGRGGGDGAKFARLTTGQDKFRSNISSRQHPAGFCGISRFGNGLFGRPELASEQPKQLWAHEDLNLGPLPCQGMNDRPSTCTNAA